MSSSIGIIGGADGPTAIFLTGSSVGSLLMAGILIAAAAGFWLHRRKCKSNHKSPGSE